MKNLSPTLAASLASGVTTLAHCWIVRRTDGLALGFTDHDEALVVEGVVCSAETGAMASSIEQSSGLSVDGLDVMGALTDGRLSESELARGRFDGAAVELWRVDWSNPADRVLLIAGRIGEVSRGRTGFTAEVRSLAAVLNQARGRLFQRTCDARLGDTRCRVDLTAPSLRAVTTVSAVLSGRAFRTAGLDTFAAGWFSGGRLTWTSGANAGASVEVRSHARLGRFTLATLDLWEPMPDAIAAGDGFSVTAGCDKTLAACRDKFGNVANFRGCPHLPGNDYVTGRADATSEGGRAV